LIGLSYRVDLVGSGKPSLMWLLYEYDLHLCGLFLHESCLLRDPYEYAYSITYLYNT